MDCEEVFIHKSYLTTEKKMCTKIYKDLLKLNKATNYPLKIGRMF